MVEKPELLAPAGGFEQLEYALYFGADAVYVGGDCFGLRKRADNFSNDELSTAVRMVHEAGKKIFVTVNALMHNDDIAPLREYLALLGSIDVDAVILSDFATLQLAKEVAPDVAIHVSTQASCTNYMAANLWHELGAKRIVLARELSIEEICVVRENVPQDLELEVFVHGAMCMAYSGRCLISNYLTHRDANRGNCTQPCRWKYTLQEETRPGVYFPIEEDGRGAFLMSSKDLAMIEHLDELAKAGIDSIKIEGRVKSAYYVATVVNAYRQVLDGALAQEFLPSEEQ
ncbi:MAG: U32 family peptidase [Actinobacteria bacterium]|nr:U32 family peptidase [Actinomycetota bacterium]